MPYHILFPLFVGIPAIAIFSYSVWVYVCPSNSLTATMGSLQILIFTFFSIINCGHIFTSFPPARWYTQDQHLLPLHLSCTRHLPYSLTQVKAASVTSRQTTHPRPHHSPIWRTLHVLVLGILSALAGTLPLVFEWYTPLPASCNMV